MMMFNKMVTFHYQLNHNTECKVKSVVNMSRQPKRLSNPCHRRGSEQPFYLPRLPLGYPADDARLTFGELPLVYTG